MFQQKFKASARARADTTTGYVPMEAACCMHLYASESYPAIRRPINFLTSLSTLYQLPVLQEALFNLHEPRKCQKKHLIQDMLGKPGNGLKSQWTLKLFHG